MQGLGLGKVGQERTVSSLGVFERTQACAEIVGEAEVIFRLEDGRLTAKETKGGAKS